MSSSHYDLITVGGGMAASALAKCMAESGAKVLVLEQETRFRDRIRGEYMMPWGVAEIAALGIYELPCRECAQKIPWIDLGMGGPPREFTTTTPQQQPGMGYSHPEMQEVLLTAAEQAGAEVRRGVTVQGVEPGAPAVVIAASGKNSERISMRLVVGADGRSSQTRKWAGFELTKEPNPFLLCGDARVLRDHLLASPDWDSAGHAYASEHDNYFAKCHTAGVWQRQVFQEQTPEARLRRQKAMPLIAEDPTRVPDYLFNGPDLPMDDSVRARFFGEV